MPVSGIFITWEANHMMNFLVIWRGWDVAMIPFARNESTRFISPTKTPEYLAGGIPVVSTSIRDVINPYAEQGLVYIADEAGDFIKGIEWALQTIEITRNG